MFGRRVERIETMPFVLNIRPICERKAHPTKNFDRALPHLGQRMQCANVPRRSGKRDVDFRERTRFSLRSKLLCTRFDCRGDDIANVVEQFTDDRLLLLANIFICSPHAETLPLFPRYFTRTDSSACSSGAEP